MKKTIVMTLLITMIITGLMPVAFAQVNLEALQGLTVMKPVRR